MMQYYFFATPGATSPVSGLVTWAGENTDRVTRVIVRLGYIFGRGDRPEVTGATPVLAQRNVFAACWAGPTMLVPGTGYAMRSGRVARSDYNGMIWAMRVTPAVKRCPMLTSGASESR
jgi:hypothetical protein